MKKELIIKEQGTGAVETQVLTFCNLKFVFFLLVLIPFFGLGQNKFNKDAGLSKEFSINAAQLAQKAYTYSKKGFFANKLSVLQRSADTAIYFIRGSIVAIDSAVLLGSDSEGKAVNLASRTKKELEQACKLLVFCKNESVVTKKQELIEEAAGIIENAVADAYLASFYFKNKTPEKNNSDDYRSGVKDTVKKIARHDADRSLLAGINKNLVETEAKNKKEIAKLELQLKATKDPLKIAKIKNEIKKLKQNEPGNEKKNAELKGEPIKISAEFKEPDKNNTVVLVENKKQKIITWSLLGVSALLLGFTVFAYRNYTLKRNPASPDLKEKKPSVEKKELIIKEQGAEAAEFISKHADIEAGQTHILKTVDKFNVEAIAGANCKAIVNLNKINDLQGINDFLKVTNLKLPEAGLFMGCVETYTQRKRRLLKKYPLVIAQTYFCSDFIFKRVFPKLYVTRWLYFFITAGRNRVLSKAESLGRLVYNGLDIVETKEIGNLTYFACVKTNRPIPEKTPSFGFFFKMKRIGKNNKPITVYKIRTMHPYAEYLQDYIYKENNLKDGGKFKNDFRITSWGKIFRKLWIDELPMVINLLKGEVKLVGVRPLSAHYLSLYSTELQEKRIHAKPGLVPPFYADMPVSLDDIMKSELAYLNAYSDHPVKTDYTYFFRAVKNIVFKNARTN